MRKYRPVSRRGISPAMLAIIIAIIAAAVGATVFFVYMFTKVELQSEDEKQLFLTGTFEEGVSVNGLPLAGLTFDQGKQKVEALKQEMLTANEIRFSIKDVESPYRFSLSDMGVSIDIEQPLRDAMLYGREGTRWDLKYGSAQPMDFPVIRTFDESKLDSTIHSLEQTEEWGSEPVNATYKVQTYSDEKKLLTGGEMILTQPKDGYSIKTAELINTIKDQIKREQYSMFEAPIEILEAKTAKDKGQIYKISHYTTTFEKSSEDRMYNIWKISDKLNGAVFYAGEDFSVNDYVGDRNEKNGWAMAMGIENGIYTPQYGGGICQVSSTMYNATILAEMKPRARVPHTIAAKYVPMGLDATISTGGPDYRVENTSDSHMYMIVKCNVPERKVTVEIWSTEYRNYDVKIWSEKVAETPKPAPIYSTNSSLDRFQVKEIRPGQAGETYDIFRSKIGKDGKVIEEKKKISSSTYNAIAPKYEVGSGIPLPADGTSIEEVRAKAAQLAQEAATPAPIDSEPLDPAVE